MPSLTYSLSIILGTWLGEAEARISTLHWVPSFPEEYKLFSEFTELPVVLAGVNSKKLSFDKNMTLTDEDCAKIFTGLKGTQIEELSFCQDRRCGVPLLRVSGFDNFSLLRDTNVKILRLRDNKIGQLGSLCDALSNVPLEVLDLSDNEISSAEEILNLNKLPKTLHTVNLTNNRLGDNGARTFLQFLRKNPNVTSANIKGHVSISKGILDDISKQLEVNKLRAQQKEVVSETAPPEVRLPVESTEDVIARVRRKLQPIERKIARSKIHQQTEVHNNDLPELDAQRAGRHVTFAPSSSEPPKVRAVELIRTRAMEIRPQDERMAIGQAVDSRNFERQKFTWRQILDAGEEFNATGSLPAALGRLIRRQDIRRAGYNGLN